MSAFDGTGTLLGRILGQYANANQLSQLKTQLEAEINQAVANAVQEIQSQGGGFGSSASNDMSAYDGRISALESSVAAIKDSLEGITKFEADATAEFGNDEQTTATLSDRLGKVEGTLTDLHDTLANVADGIDTSGAQAPAPQATTGNVATGNGSTGSGSTASAATGNVQTPAPEDVTDTTKATGAVPATAVVDGTTATIAAPVGTPQGAVDPHAVNMAAVAAGAPAPISGGTNANTAAGTDPNAGPLSTVVIPGDGPDPTAANVAAPGAYNKDTAAYNPAPYANTEQSAPKAPVINALGPDAASGSNGLAPDAALAPGNTATTAPALPDASSASTDQPADANAPPVGATVDYSAGSDAAKSGSYVLNDDGSVKLDDNGAPVPVANS